MDLGGGWELTGSKQAEVGEGSWVLGGWELTLRYAQSRRQQEETALETRRPAARETQTCRNSKTYPSGFMGSHVESR